MAPGATRPRGGGHAEERGGQGRPQRTLTHEWREDECRPDAAEMRYRPELANNANRHVKVGGDLIEERRYRLIVPPRNISSVGRVPLWGAVCRNRIDCDSVPPTGRDGQRAL